jgi:CRP/FNR family transcriptional regulator, anaerobic regulatory protein
MVLFMPSYKIEFLHHNEQQSEAPESNSAMMKKSDIERAWQGPHECQQCGVRQLVLFSDLQQQDFHLIHEPIAQKNFMPGDSLYRTGDHVKCVSTIRSGEVKLVQITPGGGQRIVRILHRGDLAGIERLVDQPANHDAVALTPTAVCEIPLSVIERLSRETPRLHDQLMKRWGNAVSLADAWLTELSTGPARARVARLLIWLEENAGGEQFYLPSREEIGAILGITTETASRMTAEFRRQKLLVLADAHQATVDVISLKKVAMQE